MSHIMAMLPDRSPPSPLADRYTIERELGRGGMASVWLAHDTREDRRVAIKVLHPEFASVVGVGRFLREIQVTTTLQHPTIVPVLDSGAWVAADGTSLPWYAMPFMDGGSLRARLTRERQLPIQEVLQIARELASGLEVAHAKGVVHRDLKPENILFLGRQAHIVDFGIAKAMYETGAERLTSTGVALGTPLYMSPEQVGGGEVDARADQYALATIVYEMLAGEVPFSGTSTQGSMARRMAEPARSLRPLRSTVPEHIDRALLRALERAPADRFPDIGASRAALDGADATPMRPLLARRVAVAAAVTIVSLGAWRMLGARRTAGPTPPSPQVVRLYQRGMQGYARRTPTGTIEAVGAFREAVRLDSSYAPAWTGLVRTYIQAYTRYFPLPSVPRDSLPALAASAALRASAADSNSAEALLAQAVVSALIDPTDRSATIRFVRRSLALDSTSGDAWHTLAVNEFDRGNADSAMSAWQRGVRIAPAYLQGVAFLAIGHYWRRQYDSASFWADSAVALDPNYLLGRTVLGQIAVERGEFDRAESAFEAARRISTGIEVVAAFAFKALTQARAGNKGTARLTIQHAESLVVTLPRPPVGQGC